MKHRILPLLVVVFVAFAGVMMWRMNRSGGGARTATDAGSAAASPDAPTAGETASNETLGDSDALSSAASERSDVAASESASDGAATRAVRVLVTWPQGLPTDESFVLSSVDFPSSKYGSAAKAAEASIQYQTDNLESVLFGGRRVDQKKEQGVRRACEPDGRGGWIAHVSEDSEVAFIELDARYTYLDPTVRFDAQKNEVELSPKLGAWLVGRVVFPAVPPADFDSAAISEIDAQINGFGMGGGGGHGKSEKLRPDGTFELGGLRAGLNYFLAIDPLVLAPITDLEINAAAGERIERNYTAIVGARVSGRVFGPDGAPLAETAVRVRASRGGMRMGADARNAVTDETGRYDLRGILPGKIMLSARREGFVPYEMPEAEALELADGQVLENVDLRVQAGNAISGRVTWPDGTPAAQAEIQVEELRAETAVRTRGPTTTNTVRSRADDAGLFRISGLAASKINVTASASRELEGAQAKFQVRRTNVDVGTELSLALEAPHALRGRVVDASGAPVPDFHIIPGANEGTRTWNEDRREFRDTDGSFVVFVPAGDYQVRAGADGYTDSARQALRVPPDARDLVFELARACEIAGVVLTPDGRPIEGATVSQVSSGRGAAFFGNRSDEAKTDAEGKFRLTEVNPGAVAIAAVADGFARSADFELVVEPGVNVEDVELRLRVGGRVEGEIFDSSGRPDPDRQIVVGSFGMDAERMGGTTKSDAAGRFVVEHVAPGNYNVMAVPRMNNMRPESGNEAEILSQLKMTPVEVFDGQTSHVVLGAPPKSPVRITGRVTQGGTPLTRGSVMIFADGASMLSSMKAAKIEADGRYTMQIDAPGDYSLIVGERMGDDQGTEFQETIPEVAEYTLDLNVPAGGIRGRVVATDGTPLSGISVRREAEGQNSIFALDMGNNLTTDASGAFEIRNLRPGTYTLRVGAPAFLGSGGSRSKYGSAVRSGVVVTENKVLEGIEIQLDAACLITGNVRGSDGAPIAGATVFVRDASGRVINPTSSCVTDSAGRFEFGQASAGTYTVSARKDKQVSRESAAVRTLAGETANVEVVLEAGTTLVVTAEDAEGKSVRANIRVVDEAGRDYARMLGADSFQRLMTEGFSSKEQTFGPLPPGKYRVTGTLDGGKSESKPLTLTGQAERSMKLRFD